MQTTWPLRALAALGIVVVSTTAMTPLLSGAANAQTDNGAERRGLCQAERRNLPFEEALGVGRGGGPSERYGVSMSEADARRLDRMAEVRAKFDYPEVRAKAEEELQGDFVSATWSNMDGLELRVNSDAGVQAATRFGAASGFADSDYEVVRVSSDSLSERSRRDTLEVLKGAVKDGTVEDLAITGFGADEWCGVLTVYLNAGAAEPEARAELEARPGFAKHGVHYVEGDPAEDAALAVGRDDYQYTQSGSLEVTAGRGVCTSSVPWYGNSGGTNRNYVVTAAHCVPQSTWSSRPNDWGNAWWTRPTTTSRMNQGGSQIANANGLIRFGAELDVAIWYTVQPASPRTAVSRSTDNFLWQVMGWWQWSPTLTTSTGGGDALGDNVCQSGRTTSFATGTGTIRRCGTLYERARAWTIANPGEQASWFYSLRESNGDVCAGDSGGTVWRNGNGIWLTGVAHAGRNENGALAGNPCYDILVYSHVGFMASAFGLTAPTGMS